MSTKCSVFLFSDIFIFLCIEKVGLAMNEKRISKKRLKRFRMRTYMEPTISKYEAMKWRVVWRGVVHDLLNSVQDSCLEG